MTTTLSDGALEVLEELQSGGNIAVPSVYPNSLAFNDHAIAYFNNAAAMCRTSDMDDFRVFGALYGIRHGLELWLKCIIQNALIDRALEAMTEPGCTFAEIATLTGQTDKRSKEQLQKALCVLRNCSEDGLTFPACREVNIGPVWADRGVEFIREHGSLPRYQFATTWSVPILDHKLLPLWERAKGDVVNLRDAVITNAKQVGLLGPLEPEKISSVCEVLNAWDPSGDAFRYPTSMGGEWYFETPHLSLDSLATLADDLESTVRAYDSLLGDAYSLATLRSPWPS